MKNIKSLLVITTILILSVIVFSSFSLANEAVVVKASVANFNNAPLPAQNTGAPLHGDVWFAFTTIGVLGAYLAFKK